MLKPFLFSTFLLLLIIISCSEDDPTAPDFFIPQFERSWHEEGNEDHTFNFEPLDDSVNSGLIKGTEDFPDSNIFNAPLLGSFSNRQVEFIVDRRFEVVQFKGSFINDDRIELNSVKGRLVLVR